MGEMLEVERLDGPTAAALAGRLTEEFDTRARVRADGACCVHIETLGASLTEVLGALEEWTAVRGLTSLCVRLNGRPYVLECRKRGESRRVPAEATAMAASEATQPS
jgi:hypothetical protein